MEKIKQINYQTGINVLLLGTIMIGFTIYSFLNNVMASVFISSSGFRILMTVAGSILIISLLAQKSYKDLGIYILSWLIFYALLIYKNNVELLWVKNLALEALFYSATVYIFLCGIIYFKIGKFGF